VSETQAELGKAVEEAKESVEEKKPAA
jgi:hypothetical protein